jgi:hypothetical protein
MESPPARRRNPLQRGRAGPFSTFVENLAVVIQIPQIAGIFRPARHGGPSEQLLRRFPVKNSDFVVENRRLVA